MISLVLITWAALSFVSVSIAISDGQTFIVNGINYYVAPESVSIISVTPDLFSAASNGLDLIPMTVLEDNTSSFTTSAFRNIITNYTSSDDVFNTGFLQAVYLKHVGPSPAVIQYPLGAALAQYETKLFMLSRAYQTSAEIQGHNITGWRTELSAGPYFLSTSTGDVYQAYRLYSDVQGAFTDGLKPNTDGTWSIMSAAIPGAQSLSIGVPSRLYFTKTAEKSLAGVRLGVKDIYDIAGVKTGCGNRAYYDLYPPRNVTAASVQRLIDAGAVIIGKMKTSQFANGEIATADWVDYHSPFNARGDGYQDPSSSSSGPGAGIGAYDWLDLGLGSDTGGSIRGPSEVNGCFGNRPSHGLVSLDGVMPLSPNLDTAGFLTRDPVLWHEAAKVLYGANITSNFTSFPKNIITSGFPTSADSEADTILLEFLGKLQAFLNTSTPTALNYKNIWNKTAPSITNNSPIDDYLKNVYPVLIAQQQYNLFTLPFYADYAAAHSGKRPFVDPVPLIRWGYGLKNFTASAMEQALHNKTVFMDWWSSSVMLPSEETCSESILLYPGSIATPTYRNIYKSAPSPPIGFDISRVSNFAEVPDMVFPIGQAAYNSTITLQEEYLPVTVDIVAAKGCDGMIFELAKALTAVEILKIPKTGSLMY